MSDTVEETEARVPFPEKVPEWWHAANAFPIRAIISEDDNALKFGEHLGATEEEILRINNAIDVTLSYYDLGKGFDFTEINNVFSNIIATRSPEELLAALEKQSPESKEIFDILGQDENADLRKALHNAIANDPTVLGGLGKLTGDGSPESQEAFKAILADPKNKELLIQLLNRTGSDKELDFNDFAETVDSLVDLTKNPADGAKAKRAKEALQRFGIADDRVDLANAFNDPMGLLKKLWDDPEGLITELTPMILEMLPEQFRPYAAEILGIASTSATVLSTYTNPDGPILKPWVEIGGVISEGAREKGEEHLRASAATVAATADEETVSEAPVGTVEEPKPAEEPTAKPVSTVVPADDANSPEAIAAQKALHADGAAVLPGDLGTKLAIGPDSILVGCFSPAMHGLNPLADRNNNFGLGNGPKAFDPMGCTM